MSYSFTKNPKILRFLSFINKKNERVRYTSYHRDVFNLIMEFGEEGEFYKSAGVAARELGISERYFRKVRSELCLPCCELHAPLITATRTRDYSGRQQVRLRVNITPQWEEYSARLFGENGNQLCEEWLSLFSKPAILNDESKKDSHKSLNGTSFRVGNSVKASGINGTEDRVKRHNMPLLNGTICRQTRLNTKKNNRNIITTTKPYSSSARVGHTSAQNEVVVFSILNKKEFTSLDDSQKAKICSSFSEEVVTKAVDYVLSRGSNVLNLGAYLYKACQGGWTVTESSLSESVGSTPDSIVKKIAERMTQVLPSGHRHICTILSSSRGDVLEVKLDGWRRHEHYILSDADCEAQLMGVLSAAGLTIETLFSSKGFEIIKEHTSKVCVDYGKLKSALFKSPRIDDNYSRV